MMRRGAMVVDPLILADIAASLPVAVYRTSVSGAFLAGNDALVELLRAESFAQLRELSVRDLYVDPSRRDHLMDRATQGQSIPTERIEIYRLDGTRAWMRVRSRTVRLPDGTVAYFQGVMEDVTELADAELRPTREQIMLGAVTAMQNGYLAGRDLAALVTDLLHGILDATHAEQGIIAEREVIDGVDTLRSWAHTDFTWDTRQHIHLLPDGREVIELDQYPGSLRSFFEAGSPVLNNSPSERALDAGVRSLVGLPIKHADDVVGLVVLANREGGFDDWTIEYLAPVAATVGSLFISLRADRERRAAQQRRDEIEILAASVIEQAADVVVGFDDDGRILSANAAASRLVEVPAEELIGRDLDSFLPEGRAGEYRRALRRSVAAGTPVEFELVSATGARRIIEATFVRSEVRDLEATVAIARDIVARKEFEWALLRAKEDAEGAARAKDGLLARMSHELRTPLNSVIGLAAILRRQIYGDLNEKQAEHMAQIESSGRHLLAVINDILDVSKYEAGAVEASADALDVADVITGAIGVVRELAVAGGVALAVENMDGLPRVRADHTRTTQVMLNLLSNAVKFTPEGGTIRVGAGVGDGVVEITVADTGIGIPDDKHEEIFGAFAQIDSSLSRRFAGTGLGLTLSRQIARLQGGDVTVSSAAGRGSVFTFSVPLADAG